MVKLLIAPDWHSEKDTGQGGIKRVWEAQVKYLPEFGIDITRNSSEADIIHTHGTKIVNIPGVPVVNGNHGLYWSRYPWGENYQDANAQVVKAMRYAVAHICPSEWVATSLRRGMCVYPEVIYHGVDTEEWEHNNDPAGYVLWNKARADYVSNPQDMLDVAKLLPNRQFFTTIGKETNNVKVFGGSKGRIPFEKMIGYVTNASVYLATARETFGINTIEALAAGVPVAGWDWGGQSEIIIDGETGYLAKPGDFDELAVCIEKCYAERDRLSPNCIEDAKKRWRWRPRIKQYADLYKRVHKYYSNPRPKVSVVVTAYNLDKYLPECLESVKSQTLEDFECLVVDDAISDETRDIVMGFQESDKRFKYRRPKENLGLPDARNYGTKLAKSLYIRHLDADDKLIPGALELEAKALDEDWGTHIVYGHLENINEDGSQQLESNGDVKRLGWPPQRFSWRHQMAHINQIPSACMMRRRVMEHSGGYRSRMVKAEDAEFWCRVTSLGFRAKKITQAVTMQHRVRADSKGALEWEADGNDGDWTAWFPWRFGAATYTQGRQIIQKIGRGIPNENAVPFGAQGVTPEGKKCWPVHDFSYPVVSVIVTVGPGHEIYLRDALDSVFAQTYPDWECFVVNDTGKEWNLKSFWDNPLAGYPWAQYLSTKGNFGVSRARNLGASHAKGQAFIWLDADDYWFPWLLERMVAMVEENNGVIYSDIMKNVDGELQELGISDFKCEDLIKTGQYPGSSVLVPRWIHEKIVQQQQGWDENIPGQEDWDYQIAVAAHAGACAYRVPEPLFVYRYLDDGNREKHKKKLDELIAYIDEKWSYYRSGRKELMCGCKSKKVITTKPKSALSSSGVATLEDVVVEGVPERTVKLEYHGPSVAAITLRGHSSKHPYRFGLQPSHKIQRVFVEDVPHFLAQRNAENKPIFTIVAEAEKPLSQGFEEFIREHM